MRITPNQLQTNAARLRELNRRIHEEYAKQPHGPEHHAACARFHNEYGVLAFPGELGEWDSKNKTPDARFVDALLVFLETDPRFHRSGYAKQRMLKYLKQVPLTVLQRERCECLIMRCLDEPLRSCGREYARLAGAIQSSVVFEAAQERALSENANVRFQAMRILDRIRARRPKGS